MAKPIKKRIYNHLLPKATRTYTTLECSELFDVSPQTIRAWIKQGLPTIDNQRPVLIYGQHLIDFLKIKNAKNKKACLPNELYCCKCRMPQQPLNNTVIIKQLNQSKLSLMAFCSVCNTKIYRMGTVAKHSVYQIVFNVQTLVTPHIKDTTATLVNHNLNGVRNVC